MAKRRSDSRVAYPKIKVQVQDLVRVVGIVDPFAPRGSGLREKLFYRAPGGNWAQRTCVGCPQQRCQCSGKIRFIEKPRIRTNLKPGVEGDGVAMW